jgi:hypothetical protein
LLGIFNPLNPADNPDQEPNQNTRVYRRLTIYVLGRIELVGRIVDAYSMIVGMAVLNFDTYQPS